MSGTPEHVIKLLNSRGLKIVHQNAKGLLSNHHLLESFVNKTSSNIESNIDVFCVSEAHIKDGDIYDNNSLYSLSGYIFLQRNRNVGTGGGVGVFLKHEMKFKRRYGSENPLESLWIEICFKNPKSVLIGCYYRPPDSRGI